ncbi:Dna2/Cas4 domain-containing protein [Pontibacillus halophilus]|uniref:Dna2/Cas4 domain-containing protein n=1 Tax=Pontibacillus halophilus TaxID=516704 RepID=UPI00047A2E05|nr:Dna2/Cas4 domain-containing protein [Pontibacillus halophilus]
MTFIEGYLLYRFKPSHVSEFAYCSKAFWLHYHGLTLYRENNDIQLGRAEHAQKNEESRNPWVKYDKREGDILVEFVKGAEGNIEGKRHQLLVYLLRGGFHYGEVRLTNNKDVLSKVTDSDEEILSLRNHLEAMMVCSSLEKPPETPYGLKCQRCSFRDYCWVG